MSGDFTDGMYSIGIDVGSVSVKVVVLDAGRTIVERGYWRHQGRPVEVLREKLSAIEQRRPKEKIHCVAVTGAEMHRLATRLGAVFVNEVIAQARAIEHLRPDTRTVIEIGGQDSKLIVLKFDADQQRLTIEDFAMNSACAAGTGSFLDQQASRLGVSIEDEFGRLALRSKTPPRIAGRCSVFAKSDMIHLQQQATPDYDIIAGLCYALARNFKGNLARGKQFTPPIAFQGGVAANIGVVKAFEDLLGLGPGELIIPQDFDKTGALGAVLDALDRKESPPYAGAQALRAQPGEAARTQAPVAPLVFEGDPSGRHYIGKPVIPPPAGRKTPAYLGVDVGSISTNVVAIDEEGNVLSKRYLMTAGRPIEAVRRGLREVGEEIADRVEILGCGTTGSGRYLTGDFIGADTVRNEITAQATAAAALDPRVDTIFEIGGQDSKYISLDNGVVVDFEMNHVCAAGTGSFLEEQAERLGINIKGEFGRLALSCKNPARLGERCTVFMESDIVHYQAAGAETDELVAGLGYSIVHNYLNRVVGDRRIGRHIFLQGGTMANAAVVAAFEKILGQQMIVPLHHDVTGAIGVGLLARDYMLQHPGPSRFRGFDLSNRNYEIESFECEDCSNACEVKKVIVEGEEPLFYGSRCMKYDVKGQEAPEPKSPDLFKERARLLMKSWIGDDQVLTRRKGPKVGLPRFLVFYDLMPFWKSFLRALGIETVISATTNKKMVHRGVESLVSEPCFPVKIAHGHTLDLLDREVDYLLIPSIINMERDDQRQSHNFLCPYVQTIPYTLRSALGLRDSQLLRPVVQFERGLKVVAEQLTVLSKALNRKPQEIRKATHLAYGALQAFRKALRERGEEILRTSNGEYGQLVVVIGRSYNTCDPGLNLDLPRKLRDLGVCPMPLDMLPLADVDISSDFPNMYWKYGQRILKAARLIREDPRLSAVYLTNFGCGPDSFIASFFKRALGEKPFLQLELDEHSADAGVKTRCEAFIDSLNACGQRRFSFPERVFPEWQTFQGNGEPTVRKLYIPYMCEHAHPLAAAFRSRGLDAEVLPPSDDVSLGLGRRFTTGKECVPCVVTAGDMIRQLHQDGVNPDEVAFFMPSGTGPCRFGNYNALHKIVLQEYGFHQVPIFAPNQDTQMYDQLRVREGDPARPAWQGIVAVDVFDKLLLAYRPYESERGITEKVYRHCVRRVCETIEKGQALLPVMREAAEAFRDIAPAHRDGKPIIGIVGEIYVRNHAFSNQNIVRRLEALGAEVRMPTFGEWIAYTNFTRLRSCKRRRQVRQLLKNFLKKQIQDADERRLTEPFHGMLPYIEEPPIEDIIALGSRYLHDSFEGEAILSLGTSLEYHEQGVSGVVNVMPLTCMPGTIVTTLFKKMREDCNNLPAISVAYDGTKLANLETRLEAFVHQARQFMESRRAGEKRS